MSFVGIHNHTDKNDSSVEEAFGQYRKEVSDHLPIIISINI